MIVVVTGPSGIGKTDTCFALLTAVTGSVYLDSDWLSAKSPIDPLSAERIMELYDLIELNIAYHKGRGTNTFFVALYQEAVMQLPKYWARLLSIDSSIKTVFLTSNRRTLEERILSRERIRAQKTQELVRVVIEMEQAAEMLKNRAFDVILDTSSMDTHQVAREIVRQCQITVEGI